MSLQGMVAETAVSIAERRAKRAGAGYYSGRQSIVIERAYLALKSSTWLVVLSGFVEPVFYLAAFGFGVGQLITGMTDGNGNPVSYGAYIAPALLATSAMNGAIYDSTWNVFFKMHFAKLYQGMMSTSLGALDVALGEIGWALLRGLAYAIGFMAVMIPLGLVPSPWGLLSVGAAVLVAFGFASFGMAVTSYIKSFQGMNWINFFLLPMFLFSGTFYPLSVYPPWLQTIVQALPLWQGVDLMRNLNFGTFNWNMLGEVAYFVVMIVVGLVFTTRRLTALFMR
jgi:lipooligosaccharide transport system permease protein